MRSQAVQTQVTPEMHALIKQCAAAYGVSVSAWAAIALGKAAQMQMQELSMHAHVAESIAAQVVDAAAEVGGDD